MPVNHVFCCHDHVNRRIKFQHNMHVSVVVSQHNTASLPVNYQFFLLIFNFASFWLVHFPLFFSVYDETFVSVFRLSSNWMHVWCLIYRAVFMEKISYSLFVCKWKQKSLYDGYVTLWHLRPHQPHILFSCFVCYIKYWRFLHAFWTPLFASHICSSNKDWNFQSLVEWKFSKNWFSPFLPMLITRHDTHSNDRYSCFTYWKTHFACWIPFGL